MTLRLGLYDALTLKTVVLNYATAHQLHDDDLHPVHQLNDDLERELFAPHEVKVIDLDAYGLEGEITSHLMHMIEHIAAQTYTWPIGNYRRLNTLLSID